MMKRFLHNEEGDPAQNIDFYFFYPLTFFKCQSLTVVHAISSAPKSLASHFDCHRSEFRLAKVYIYIYLYIICMCGDVYVFPVIYIH